MLNLNKISATVQLAIKKCQDFFTLALDQQENLAKQITLASAPDFNLYILTIFSALIISLGLIASNWAIILAGLLFLPLAWPFLAVSLALVKGDSHLLGRALLTLLKVVALLFIFSFLIGLFVPNEKLISLVAAKSQSGIIELLLALLAGFLAANLAGYPKFGGLAASLLIGGLAAPAISSAGFAFALGNFHQAARVGLIILGNFTALFLTAASFFCLAGFKKTAALPAKEERLLGRLPWRQLFLLALLVIFLAFTFRLADQARQLHLVKGIIIENLPDGKLAELYIDKNNDEYFLTMKILAANNLSSRQMDKLLNILIQKLHRSVRLEITVIPTFSGNKTVVPSPIANSLKDSVSQDLNSLRNKVFPSIKSD